MLIVRNPPGGGSDPLYTTNLGINLPAALPALSDWSGITSFDFTGATVAGDVGIQNSGDLTSFTSAALASAGSVTFTGCSALADATIGTIGTLKTIGGDVGFQGCALTEDSVNALLALLVSLDGTNGTTLWTGTVDISGGMNAVPSGQGVTDAATLTGRGATVITANYEDDSSTLDSLDFSGDGYVIGSWPNLTAVGARADFHDAGSVTSLALPNLATVGENLHFGALESLPGISLPALTGITGNAGADTVDALTSFSLAAMVNYGGTIYLNGTSANDQSSQTPPGALADLTLGTVGTLQSIAGDVLVAGAALTDTSVNALLALLVSLDGTGGTTLWTGTVDVSGGTNAAPSGQGVTDAATLTGRGATVTTN